MKICAVTMVYRDYWALAQWYAHFSRLLGAENLFIVVHGTDDSIAARCPGAHISQFPRDDLRNFDKRRAVHLNALSHDLRRSYDWVIRTDADELICFDPLIYDDLAAVFSRHPKIPALFALGLDLVEAPQDAPYDAAKPLGAQRRSAAFSGHYSKAFALGGDADLLRHGVKVTHGAFRSFPYVMPRGLYLVHLKFANLSETRRSNSVRSSVATPQGADEQGLPGDGWRYADEDTQKFLSRHRASPMADWSTAERAAYRALADAPKRFRRINFLKAPSLKFDTRTLLPDWLAQELP